MNRITAAQRRGLEMLLKGGSPDWMKRGRKYRAVTSTEKGAAGTKAGAKVRGQAESEDEE